MMAASSAGIQVPLAPGARERAQPASQVVAPTAKVEVRPRVRTRVEADVLGHAVRLGSDGARDMGAGQPRPRWLAHSELARLAASVMRAVSSGLSGTAKET